MPGWSAAAEEPERRQLLEVDGKYVRFRHELARNAIRSSLPIAARRRLHAEILAALLAADADPADIVHHAEAAGADDVVADYALVAARRAAALESNREAYSHYRRASDFVDRLPLLEQAAVLEELANAAYVVGRLEHAFPAIERAIALYGELGDERGGRPLHAGPVAVPLVRRRRRRRARKALEAIAILEPLGESVELARAYSGALPARDARRGRRAGVRVGRAGARARDPARRREHAGARAGQHRQREGAAGSPRDRRRVLEAHAIADAAGDRHEATRALVNLAYTQMLWVQPDAALRHAEQALAYAQQHEMHTLASYVATMIAWLRLRAGEWDEAERVDARRDRARHHRRPADRQHGPGRAGRAAGRSRCRRAAGRARGSGRSHGRAAADRAGPRAGDGVGADARHADAGRAVRQADREDPAANQVRRLGRGARSRLGGRRRDRRRARPAGVGPLRRHAPARLAGGRRRLRRGGLDATTER